MLSHKELYKPNQLNDKQPQSVLSRLKKMKISQPDRAIELLVGKISFGVLSDCIVCMDTKIMFLEAVQHVAPRDKVFYYASVTGASSNNKPIDERLLIHIGGNKTETIDIRMSSELMRELISYINSKIDQRARQSSNASLVSSAADEIAKYHSLMEQGIISEEEFNAKKKELLGI